MAFIIIKTGNRLMPTPPIRPFFKPYLATRNLRILQAYEQNEGSIRQLAKRFKVDFATIWQLLKKHHTQGTLIILGY